MEERWFSTSEIAAYLGVKQDKIYRLIGTEGLPARKTGRFWKFRKDEIDAWKGKSTPAGKKGKSKTKPEPEPKPEPNLLSRLGFSSGKGGVHTARTMMLKELETLLAYVGSPEAEKKDYQRAVTEENCLGKRSTKTRTLTFRHLADLYSLDRTCLLFRALLFFWSRDLPGRPLLALLCAYARDALLRSSASFILEHPESSTVSRESLEALLDAPEPGRFRQGDADVNSPEHQLDLDPVRPPPGKSQKGADAGIPDCRKRRVRPSSRLSFRSPRPRPFQLGICRAPRLSP